MIKRFLKHNVCYQIFDKSNKDLSYIYNKSLYYGDIEKIYQANKNLQIIKSYYNLNDIILLKQIHSSIVIDIDNLHCFNNILLVGDGLVSSKEGVILAIETADCVPVLFSCSKGSTIGIAHCGWRGTKAGIISAVIGVMVNKGVKNILAIIGPSIFKQSYEVDSNYYQNFIMDCSSYSTLFFPSSRLGYYNFDLRQLVKRKLKEFDVDIVHCYDEDTYLNLDKYPSYRRNVHMKEKNDYKILSTIAITKL